MEIKNKARLDSLLLIGSTGRKAGKTTLACRIIEKHKNKNIIAIKIAAIRKTDRKYHKELTADKKGFVILEETEKNTNNDTSKMLTAGAKKAFLLCAKKESLKNALECLLEKMPKESVFICESNSLRKILEPAVFVMVKGKGRIKPSARQVKKYADRIITFNKKEFDNLVKVLRIIRGKWSITNNAKSR
jgi:molybdopterin-guanine dinucleotide biosynthesis protein